VSRVVLAVAVLVVGVGLSPRAAAQDPDLKIGMMQSTFRDVQPAVVQALSRPFQTLFQRHTGLAGSIELVSSADVLASKLKDRSLDLGVFHGFEFAQQRTLHPDLTPVVVSVPVGEALEACIIVPIDSPVKQLSDLKGIDLVVPRSQKPHVYAYIEKTRAGLPADSVKLVLKPTITGEEALNGVAGGEMGAVLIEVAALKAYSHLQPGASKQIREVVRSERFPPTVIAYKPGGKATAAMISKVRSGMINAEKSPQGRTLMMLWNLKGFAEVPVDYEAQLRTILKSYPVPAAK
jgi:ABC-type phosphate/phosphonate transport system substrate-binding protein